MNKVAKVVCEGKTSMLDVTFTVLDRAGGRQGLLFAHASRMPLNHDPPSGESDQDL